MVTLLCPAEHTSQQYATITRLKPTFCIFDVNWLGNIKTLGCHRRSVELSAPTILLPRVQVPSTPFMLLSFIELVLYLLCEKIENKQKEARFGPFKNFYGNLQSNFPCQNSKCQYHRESGAQKDRITKTRKLFCLN